MPMTETVATSWSSQGSILPKREKHICESWKFVYQNPEYPDHKKEYPDGYYLHIRTGEKYAFRPGIAHIVGEDNEDKIYSMWWTENG